MTFPISFPPPFPSPSISASTPSRCFFPPPLLFLSRQTRSSRSLSTSSSSPLITTRAADVGEASTAQDEPAADDKAGGGGRCRGCGKAEMEKRCNGEGRIEGGIGSVPGFGWWPIKAYRPCPSFLQAGGRYQRSGQSLDEIAFGRKGSNDDLDVLERLKKS